MKYVKLFEGFVNEDAPFAHDACYLVLWNDNAAPGIAATDKGGYSVYTPDAFFNHDGIVGGLSPEDVIKLKQLEFNKPITSNDFKDMSGYVQSIEKVPFEAK